MQAATRPWLGGLLLFMEPVRFQDVIAQGKPSFLPGINKLLMAHPLSPGRLEPLTAGSLGSVPGS